MEGQTIQEDFTIEVAVDRPELVAEMRFLLDGVPLGILSSPPFSISLDVSSLLKGSHTLTVTVRDAVSVERSEIVTFAMPSAGGPPSIVLTDGKEESWLSTALKGATQHPAVLLGIALFAFGIVGSVREVVIKITGTRCPICGLTYRSKGGCPHCLGNASNPRRPLGQMLVASKLITPNELSTSLADSLAQNRRLGEILVEKRLLTDDALAQGLSIQQRRGILALRRDAVAFLIEAEASDRLGPFLYPVILALAVCLLLLQYSTP